MLIDSFEEHVEIYQLELVVFYLNKVIDKSEILTSDSKKFSKDDLIKFREILDDIDQEIQEALCSIYLV